MHRWRCEDGTRPAGLGGMRRRRQAATRSYWFSAAGARGTQFLAGVLGEPQDWGGTLRVPRVPGARSGEEQSAAEGWAMLGPGSWGWWEGAGQVPLRWRGLSAGTGAAGKGAGLGVQLGLGNTRRTQHTPVRHGVSESQALSLLPPPPPAFLLYRRKSLSESLSIISLFCPIIFTLLWFTKKTCNVHIV